MSKLAIVKVKLDRDVNCYVVSCASTKEAVIIDPGLPAEKIVEQATGLKVKFILATHCHPGHVGGKDDVKAVTGGETALHSADAKQFLRSADRYLIDGDELEFGEFKVSVIHTPGHTPGSQCLLVNGRLISGDTLFLDGCGRTDLPGSDPEEMYRTLTHRLSDISDDTRLFPGHLYSADPSAPMGDVRQHNRALVPASAEEWLAMFAR